VRWTLGQTLHGMMTRINDAPAVWGMVLDVNLDFLDVDHHSFLHDISNDVANQNMYMPLLLSIGVLYCIAEIH